jgi:glycosyltransferase involved in cell wall biosynthesis
MAEYLPKFGWEPIFIAPKNGYYGRAVRVDVELLSVIDKFLVYRAPFFYPFNNRDSNLLARIARRFWETLVFPDGKIFWNVHVKKLGTRAVIQHKPSIFFITGTPFSTFLLAPYIKKLFQLPVILDYRDPWTGFYRSYFPIKTKVNLKIERRCIEAANLVTTASFHMIEFIKRYLGPSAIGKRFFGFPYGYNGEFFRRKILPIGSENSDEKATATFAGFIHGDVDSRSILRGIRMAIEQDPEVEKKLRINCYGTLFGHSKNSMTLIEKYCLQKHIRLFPFLPYNEFLITLRKSTFLILPLGRSPLPMVLYPTKLFDYLGVKRPILYIGGNGQVAETIKACNAGICVKPEPTDIAIAIIEFVKRGHAKCFYTNNNAYEQLDRINIYEAFSKELENLI